MKKGWSLGVRIQPAVNFALKMWFGVSGASVGQFPCQGGGAEYGGVGAAEV